MKESLLLGNLLTCAGLCVHFFFRSRVHVLFVEILQDEKEWYSTSKSSADLLPIFGKLIMAIITAKI